MNQARANAGWLTSAVPILGWLPRYRAEWLRSDALAGLTLAAYAIPVSLAYATLAGLPPHFGVYCYLVGGFAYACFGGSRQLAVGPTSAIAMLVGTTVATMADGNPARFTAIASLAAMCVAVLAALAWLLRLSGLVNFISETILVGFKAGAALTIAMTQLPKLFGVPGGGDHFFERAGVLARQLPSFNGAVLTLGVIALAVLVLGDKILPGRPIALFVVAGSIVATGVFQLDQWGVSTVGELPAGLPKLSWPSLRPRDVDGVLPLAAACFLLAYVEAISAARALAARHGDEIDPRQELLGLGAANLAGAFSHGFPMTGGLSQSAVNDKAGAKSQLSLVFASTAIAVCLLFLTGLLRNLPNVILATIVLVAVKGLIDVAAFRHLWLVRRSEFALALVAFAGVLLLGILQGVLLAVVASILMLLTAVARPHVAFLGRIPGTSRFTDLARHESNETIAGVIVFRVEASLLYFNVDHVRGTVWSRVLETDGLKIVICDLSNSPRLDLAGAKMLGKLLADLDARGVKLRIVEAHAHNRDLLRAEGLETRTGYLGRHISVSQALAEFDRSDSSPPSLDITHQHSVPTT